jgi:phenylacetate-coenzyme A ligase PaaK-like adenylate-forming protein
MVKIRGVNVWPEALDAALFAIEGVREYEASVETDADGREQLQVQLELESDLSDTPTRARAAIREVTGLGAEVTVVSEGAISRAVEARFKKRRRLHDRRTTAAGG